MSKCKASPETLTVAAVEVIIFDDIKMSFTKMTDLASQYGLDLPDLSGIIATAGATRIDDAIAPSDMSNARMLPGRVHQ